MDVNSSGNLWFDYIGLGSAGLGFGLAEITDPTTNPTLVPILDPGTFMTAGGVYASNAGTTLNVTDQTARTISQYHLPLSPGGTPFNVLGPTLAPFGLGNPVSGGFNQNGRLPLQADGEGWINIGRIAANPWRASATRIS